MKKILVHIHAPVELRIPALATHIVLKKIIIIPQNITFGK